MKIYVPIHQSKGVLTIKASNDQTIIRGKEGPRAGREPGRLLTSARGVSPVVKWCTGILIFYGSEQTESGEGSCAFQSTASANTGSQW